MPFRISLPRAARSLPIGTAQEEKKDRKNNIRFLTRYFPQIELREIPNMAHAELVIIHPEEFCRYAEEFLTERTEGEEHK